MRGQGRSSGVERWKWFRLIRCGSHVGSKCAVNTARLVGMLLEEIEKELWHQDPRLKIKGIREGEKTGQVARVYTVGRK
jgi:hypothetical protein